MHEFGVAHEMFNTLFSYPLFGKKKNTTTILIFHSFSSFHNYNYIFKQFLPPGGVTVWVLLVFMSDDIGRSECSPL